MTLDELLQAAHGGPQDREAVTDEALKAFMEEESRAIAEHVANIRTALYAAGLAAADGYCALAKDHRLTSQETPFIPRVRWDERYQTPSCAWEKKTRKAIPLDQGGSASRLRENTRCSYIASVPRKNTGIRQKMKIIVLSENIRIHRKTKRVPAAAFEEAPLWARMAAEIVEDRFCRLRKLTCTISDASRAMHRFNDILKKE